MLKLLDTMIRDILVDPLLGITSDAQVRFQPPDALLRADVVNLNQVALDVYLTDLRENRKLRTNERVRTVENGAVFNDPAPTRVDCHYLVTAWSPVQLGPGIEPTLDEHQLLYDAATLLIRNSPFNPSRIYAPASLKLAEWKDFQTIDLPTAVVPAEPFGKLSEFWTTMGQDMRWKPAVYLIVTLPLVMLRELEGMLVTTRITSYQQDGLLESAEVWLQIGGSVLHGAVGADAPVPSAWVQIETLTGTTLQRVITDDEGHFTFERLRRSQYRLRTGALGLGTQLRVVDVPAETGEYDLRFP